MRMAGKVALISGGARGIGAATARLLSREGAAVVIGDLLEKEGRQTEAQIVEAGGRALFSPLDVTEEADWQRGSPEHHSRIRQTRRASQQCRHQPPDGGGGN